MDPRHRADETLARARARGAFVVTPDDAISPMDASSTVRIPRNLVNQASGSGPDPDATGAFPQPPGQGSAQGQAPQGQGQVPQGQPSQSHRAPAKWDDTFVGQLPTNSYEAQREPGTYGQFSTPPAQEFRGWP